MSDFTTIETQEQLNAVIGARISAAQKAAEEKAAAKYSDYAAIKQQNEEYASQITDLQKQLQSQEEKIASHKDEVESLNAKVRSYESSSLKTKIALETGLPYKMAERLTGDDEKSIRADAEAMVQLINAQKPVAPVGSSEPVITGNNKDAAYKQLAASLFEE